MNELLGGVVNVQCRCLGGVPQSNIHGPPLNEDSSQEVRLSPINEILYTGSKCSGNKGLGSLRRIYKIYFACLLQRTRPPDQIVQHQMG